ARCHRAMSRANIILSRRAAETAADLRGKTTKHFLVVASAAFRGGHLRPSALRERPTVQGSELSPASAVSTNEALDQIDGTQSRERSRLRSNHPHRRTRQMR